MSNKFTVTTGNKDTSELNRLTRLIRYLPSPYSRQTYYE